MEKQFQNLRKTSRRVSTWENLVLSLFRFGPDSKSTPRDCHSRHSFTSSASYPSILDFPFRALNKSPMPRPEAAHRVKSYSAATGYVYQYYFYEVEKARRGNSSGTEYAYMVSVDRQRMFPLKVFVVKDALERWSARTGQQLTGTEEYAVAKMRLFQAFDEIEGLADKSPELAVDDSNLDGLLSQLDL
jgi:hypothetical protein